MDDDAIRAATAAERRSFADMVEGLDEAALRSQSLCGAWTVHQVAGHLAAAVAPPLRRYLGAAVRARGSFGRANDAVARAMAERPAKELAAHIRDHADSRFAPPLLGARAPLTDVLVHGGDIRGPLGLGHDDDHAALRPALDFVTSGRAPFFVGRGWLNGLRLIAEDLAWASGEGQAVQGRGIDVLMAACGRTAVLPRLSGTGVEVLRSRLPA